MTASENYPIYTAIAVASDGTKYTLTKATTDLTLDESDGTLAQKVSLFVRNVKVGSSYLSSLLKAKMRIYVYANDGKKKDEVFRGFIWDITKNEAIEKEIKILAYDHLIYLQQSKDCLYFSAGKYTESIVKSICNKWGVNCSYEYIQIKHPKLPLNNNYISDMLIEVLDAAKKQKGTKYVIRSVKDVTKILKQGSNATVYHFQKKKSVISTKSTTSLEGLVTKVVIYGNQDDNERRTVKATVNGSTDTYGTLQDVVTMSGNTTLAEAKEEANEIIKEKGKPEETHELKTIDIPWVHKGDLIKVTTENLKGNYLVKSITHDAMNKTMSMEVTKA